MLDVGQLDMGQIDFDQWSKANSTWANLVKGTNKKGKTIIIVTNVVLFVSLSQ